MTFAFVFVLVFLISASATPAQQVSTPLPTQVPRSEANNFSLVHGIKVYGLETKIDTLEKAKELSLAFDWEFESELPSDVLIKDKWEQREFLMPKELRFVEFVVTESTYNEFLKKKEETGVDYVEWVQIHLDLMNRVAKTQPGLENFRVEIKRVIVVADSFKSSPIDYTKDIDGMWFNNEDYRFKTENTSGYRWRVNRQENGDLLFHSVISETDGRKDEVTLPPDQDLLQEVANNLLIDCGLTHELSHLIWNLPDEYVFDSYETPFIYKAFSYRTGSFTSPELSPYLKTLLLRNKNENIRGYYTDPRAIGLASFSDKFIFYGLVPKKVTFQIDGVTDLTIFRSSFVKADYYATKTFSGVTGIISISDGSFVLPEEAFTPQIVDEKEFYSTVYVLQTMSGENLKELYFPVSLLNIPAIIGEEEANYKIAFTGYEPDTAFNYTQVMEYVEAGEMESYLARKNQILEPLYATMIIPGTKTTVVWSLRFY